MMNQYAGNKKIGIMVGAFALFMLGLAFLSAPLYNYLCRVTGFGGTTQVAVQAPSSVGQGFIKVRFDANIGGNLNWKFWTDATPFDAQLGKTYKINYYAQNLSNETISATASYNVSPNFTGSYFNKIQCFCFTKQTLKPGEIATLPVQFFIDESINKDSQYDNSGEITLSYTFYQQ